MLSACVRQMEDVRGVESYIRKIELEGVNRFKKKELLSYLNIGESSNLFWRPRYVFTEAMLPIDAERILELYRAYGYYDAEVVSMVPDTKVGRIRLFGKHKGERKPGKTRIKIVVREGAPTKVTDLELHWPEGGPAGPPDKHATEDAIAESALLKEGAVAGLSFGYRVRQASGEKPRELKDLELVEVSLVTFPMQPQARVHAVSEG